MTAHPALAFLRLASAITETDARAVVSLAVQRGASPDEARKALQEWREMQAASVTTIYMQETA